MKYVTRELPPAEWPRLVGLDLARALPFHAPEDVAVIVVEDDGQIVGALAVLRVVQIEGVWVDPRYRMSGKIVSIARRIVPAAMRVARRWAPWMAFSAASDQSIAGLLTRHAGAMKLACDAYVIPLRPLGDFLCQSHYPLPRSLQEPPRQGPVFMEPTR